MGYRLTVDTGPAQEFGYLLLRKVPEQVLHCTQSLKLVVRTRMLVALSLRRTRSFMAR